LSGKVVGWAFDEGEGRNLELSRRFVLVAYADNADRYGKCWPGRGEIIRKTGTSRATYYRAKDELVAEGLMQFCEDEKGREYVQLAVPWASHGETDSSHDETVPPGGLSQPETGNSHGEKPESHGETGSNKGTVKEPSGTRSSAHAISSTAQFVLNVLDDVAFTRNVSSPKVPAVEETCAEFEHLDLEAEVRKFAHYWTEGPGEKRKCDDVAWKWRQWLGNVKDGSADGATVHQLPARGAEDFGDYDKGTVRSG
jgi:hypothetical protein